MPTRFNPVAARSVAIATVSSLTVLFGVLPPLPNPSNQSNSNTAAYAQVPDKVVRYARAVYRIEQLRQRSYAEAKRIMGGNIPENVCGQSNLPDPVAAICASFKEDSVKILGKKDIRLSNADFNDIMQRQQRDPLLRRQIEMELIRIQQQKR